MAVVTTVYPAAKQLLLSGQVDLDSDTLKVMLLDDTGSYSAEDTALADVSSAEITGTGYTAGGETITGLTASESDGTATLSADDVTWTGASFSTYNAVLYTGTDLVCHIDFNDEQAPSSEDFILEFPGGLLGLV